MKNFFGSKPRAVLSAALVIISAAVTVYAIVSGSLVSAGDGAVDSVLSVNVASNSENNSTSDGGIVLTATEPDEAEKTEPDGSSAASKKSKSPTTEPVTTEQPTTEKSTIPWATAIPVEHPADHQAQLDAGYLVAIDNPDTIYHCSQVTLTDEDRDLLERLCYGEFGTGGFVGAALIAQAVKDAMCFDGYTSVEEVIIECKYTGSTTSGTSQDCRDAVKYIFDENHDAVQHRIMYMYAPYLVDSAFHESQNYILTYQGIRFFDRWNY